MQITDELLDKLASLSRLSFNESEKAELRDDFQKMLNFVNKLQELDTTGVEALIHMTEEYNRLRPDIAEQVLPRKESLKNAPNKDEQYFRVPKVVKK